MVRGDHPERSEGRSPQARKGVRGKGRSPLPRLMLAKAHYFVIDLPHSDESYVRAFPVETTEAFLEGQVEAFRYWGGVPRRILYDNTTLAVARILGDGRRQKTQAFSELQSHYLFAERFGRPGKGNDKGKVENLVKVARRSFFVPRPRFPSWAALNVWLEEQCRKRRERRQRGHRETIGERFERDRQALLALPAAAYETCETRPGRVTSLSLVRYHSNDYSVPTEYGHRQVLIKGYVDKVVICAGSEEIARHRRSYGREGLIFHPLHYLALLERKTGALEQAAPLEGWQLPEEFAALRRRLEARLGKAGAREYVQVLRLLEERSGGLSGAGGRGSRVMAKPKVLLEAQLKALRLPTFRREYDKVARQCAAEGLDCPRYLLRLSELELLDREQRATERRIKTAKFPVLKSLETFEFRSIPSLNESLVLELAQSEYLDRRENVLALGNSGTGKTHLALALGLAACQKGYRVRFTTAPALVHELLEARDGTTT